MHALRQITNNCGKPQCERAADTENFKNLCTKCKIRVWLDSPNKKEDNTYPDNLRGLNVWNPNNNYSSHVLHVNSFSLNRSVAQTAPTPNWTQ